MLTQRAALRRRRRHAKEVRREKRIQRALVAGLSFNEERGSQQVGKHSYFKTGSRSRAVLLRARNILSGSTLERNTSEKNLSHQKKEISTFGPSLVRKIDKKREWSLEKGKERRRGKKARIIQRTTGPFKMFLQVNVKEGKANLRNRRKEETSVLR